MAYWKLFHFSIFLSQKLKFCFNKCWQFLNYRKLKTNFSIFHQFQVDIWKSTTWFNPKFTNSSSFVNEKIFIIYWKNALNNFLLKKFYEIKFHYQEMLMLKFLVRFLWFLFCLVALWVQLIEIVTSHFTEGNKPCEVCISSKWFFSHLNRFEEYCFNFIWFVSFIKQSSNFLHTSCTAAAATRRSLRNESATFIEQSGNLWIYIKIRQKSKP